MGRSRAQRNVQLFGPAAVLCPVVAVVAIVAGKIVVGLVLGALGAICAFTLYSRLRGAGG